MKKAILLSSILAVGAAFAEATGTDVECDNLIGALDVTISTTRAQTLVSVPFLGYNGGAVKVEEMVKTSNLGENSKLYVADGNGGYNTWKLNDEGAWVADGKVTIGANGTPVASASEQQGKATVNRGDAFWIQPKNPSSDKIYLLGQGVTTAGLSTVAAGWNLVGNTSGIRVDIANAGYKLVENNEVQGYSDGEKICVQNPNGKLDTYTYRTKISGWSFNGARVKSENVYIEPGQGFWFYSKATTIIKW